MVFRAISKLMLSYSEQQEKNAKGNKSNKEIHGPVSGKNIFGNFGFEPNFPTKLEKTKITTLINASIGSIFWNKNMSCHNTFNELIN